MENLHRDKKLVAVFAVTAIFGALTACQPNISPSSYAVGSVGQVNRTVRGIIVNSRPVAISGTQSGVGAGAGAVAGGAAASSIGNGGGSTVLRSSAVRSSVELLARLSKIQPVVKQDMNMRSRRRTAHFSRTCKAAT